MRTLLESWTISAPLWTVLAAVPLGLLARRRVYPHGSLVALLGVAGALSLLAVVLPAAMAVVLAWDFLVLVVATIDWLTLPRAADFSAQRTIARVASLGRPHDVVLTLAHHGRQSVVVHVRDDVPAALSAVPESFAVAMTALSRAELHYRGTPACRGTIRLDCVHVQVRSRWGCWKRFVSCPAPSVVQVYPNLVQLSEYALLARTNRLSLMGVRRSRRIGQDHDFERLRDYSLDDNYKHIDWRATARRRRLTVKEYQSSQSQRLVFLLDCGRMMRTAVGELTLLDHALNALLMLSYVALRQGDGVGLICFSDRVHGAVPVRAGLRQMNHLLHATFERFPTLVESRYDLAFLQLATRFRKRALVVLLTNLIDDVNGLQVEQYLRVQLGRHLPLCVLLRDRALFEAAGAGEGGGVRGLYRAAAAAHILNWRREVLSALVHRGVLVLDVFPDELTAPLVNRYLAIKARHLL
jgi:uncharacterized protein (DUF58 family)